MTYFEITGLPFRPSDGEFSATVNIELEKGRGLSLLSDDGYLPRTLVDAVIGRKRFSGEIMLNSLRIDPMPAKARQVGILGEVPGIVPGRTVRRNLELALEKRGFDAKGDDVFLIDDELSSGALAGLDDVRAGSLGAIERTILAATRILLAGCDLLIIRNLPVPYPVKPGNDKSWKPGLHLDALLELKNLLRRYRMTWINLVTDPACVHILSDRVAVFSKGNLVQEGSLKECVNAPASQLVADYLSFPRMNYRKVNVERDGPFIMLQSGRYGFKIGEYAKRHLSAKVGREAVIGVRPENLGIRVYETGDPTVLNLARVNRVDSIPGQAVVSIDVDGEEWLALVEPGRSLFTGQLVELRPDPDKLLLFHPETGATLLD